METIEARVIQKIATPEQWRTISYTPYKGEILIVGDASGKVTNIKVGDGSNDFDGLEYMFDSIQQNANYIPVSGYDLPTPEADSGFSIVFSGEYTFNSDPAFTVSPSSIGIISWDGSVWSLESELSIPDNASKAQDWVSGEYDKNTFVVHNGIVWVSNKTTEEEPSLESEDWDRVSSVEVVENFRGGDGKAGSANDVKDLNERVQFYDRPDIPYHHYLIDGNRNIIDRLLSDKADSYRFLPEGVSFYYVDRPDLGAVILTGEGDKIINHTGSNSSGGQTPTGNPNIYLPVFNPGEQVGFDRNEPDSEINSYTDLISYYDNIMSQANVNPNVTPYVTKRSIGTSTLDNHEIYLYSFTPPNPKAKVLLVAGTHASEKMYIHVLKSFASDLALNWTGNTFLDFLRWNIQIDILPCRMPYTMGNSTNRVGGRISPETAPIPFSWTKTGTQATITFDVNDFPSDGFLSGASYFTSVPDSALNGKIRVGIRTSSDEVVLPPNAYVLTTVLAGNSVVLETEVVGDGSGTGTFQVWTDPNRNIPLSDGAKWNAYYTAYTALMSDDDGINYGTIVGKGTRPLSLKESRAFLSLIEEENYDYTMDGHAAGGDCYIAYDPTTGFIPNIDKMLSQSGAFVSTVNDKIFDRTNENAPFTEITLTREHNTPTQLIEWGSGLVEATPEEVKNAYRWMTIVLTDSVTTIINK